MNRRFNQTLMALAIAAFSAAAFAAAPVINALKSPIIVDDEPVTGPAHFYVYPDALNLDAMGTDDNVGTAGVIWSYSGSQALGASRYMINGAATMDLSGGDDPNSPSASKNLVSAGDDTGTNGAQVGGGTSYGIRDGNIRTLTFRDNSLSAITIAPGTNGTLGVAGTQVNELVTLYASDGTTYSTKTFAVFTEEKGGVDRLQGASTASSTVSIVPTGTGTLGWISVTVIGTVTLTSAGSGLCLFSPAAGENFGEWVSPFNQISLTANNVYRIRLTMDNNTAAGIAAGVTPLWDFIIDNFNPNSGATENKYSMDWLNLDNFVAPNADTGNASNVKNGIGTTAAQHTFDIWYAPAPITATDWNDASTGEFTALHDQQNDMRLQFRVIDVNIAGNANPNFATDAGSLCIRSIAVNTVPLKDLTVNSNVYDVTNITAASHSVASIFGTTTTAGGTASTLVDFTGGALTVSPNVTGSLGSHAWDVEVVGISPGNTSTRATGGGAAENDDNWPFLWVANQLLMGTVTASAPNSLSAINPPDGFQMSWDSPTTEILMISQILATTNVLGMPKTTPTQYKSFFYTAGGSNEVAASLATNHDNRLRMQVGILNNTALNSGGLLTNTGGMKFTEFKVDRLDLPSN